MFLFAQSTNWEDYGLDEEAVKYLTEKEKQDILGSPTLAQTQAHMQQQIQEKGVDAIRKDFPFLNAQDTAKTPASPEIVNCFDYYTFGSIEADMTSQTSTAVT